MPIIASVYHNRLRIGASRSRPTRRFFTRWVEARERLLYAAMDSVADHPYNTYTHPGLPPGPHRGSRIGGDRAAHFGPQTPTFLYFVARTDGTHIFSTNPRRA